VSRRGDPMTGTVGITAAGAAAMGGTGATIGTGTETVTVIVTGASGKLTFSRCSVSFLVATDSSLLRTLLCEVSRARTG